MGQFLQFPATLGGLNEDIGVIHWGGRLLRRGAADTRLETPATTVTGSLERDNDQQALRQCIIDVGVRSSRPGDTMACNSLQETRLKELRQIYCIMN